MKFKYLIINLTEGVVTGSNDLGEAEEFMVDDEFTVIRCDDQHHSDGSGNWIRTYGEGL